MEIADWITVISYLIAMIVMSWYCGRSQTSIKEYFLAGNSLGPWPIALSSAATQCSTNSLLGAPAFVAFSGGLLWLQYELAVPLAMAILLTFVFPIYRRLGVFSVYDYIERRFGKATRLILSLIFQCLRAFSTGVTIYGIALVLEYILDIPFGLAVIFLGFFTIIYDAIGGMRAVIWSDVIQLGVLMTSVIVALVLTFSINGGVLETFHVFSTTGKQDPLAFGNLGIVGDDTFGFWPMLFGGIFLYVSYYGCDQTQAQRELSTRSINDSRRSLLIGGMIRFPIVMLYCLLGVAIGAYAIMHPEFTNQLIDAEGRTAYNLTVPIFVLEHFT